MKRFMLVCACLVFLAACIWERGSLPGQGVPPEQELSVVSLFNEAGGTIAERISLPGGFRRVEVAAGSYQQYLRDLSLKPHGSPVKYYDGRVKPGDFHEAVIDIDVGDRDLQQCADAVIRLRGGVPVRQRPL